MPSVYLLVGAGVIVVGVLAFAAWGLRGPDLSRYQALRNPAITTMPDRTVLVVKSKGDPAKEAGRNFGTLISTYYKLPRGSGEFQAPCARWDADISQAKNTWIGSYALPVGDSVTPAVLKKIGAKADIEVERWKGGPTAEILHIGSYATETPTIQRLHKFIADSGYVIAGQHEEEYIKGPGMLFKGNPDEYQTVIRYAVRRR